MMKELLNHRSIRKYTNKPVSEATLNQILDAGIRASNTGNMQMYSMIVSRDEQKRKKLWEAHFKQEMVLQAPVHITFCADINRFHKWCEFRDTNHAYDNFLWFINGAIDAVLASQNVCVAAESNGLGICYLGTATYNADMLIDTLELPNGVIPVAAIVLGYPDEKPPLTDRLPLEAVVHKETYNNYNKQSINKLYFDKEQLQETKDLIEINKTENLAQIFTQNRYKKEDNIFFSKKYLEIIEKQGFINH